MENGDGNMTQNVHEEYVANCYLVRVRIMGGVLMMSSGVIHTLSGSNNSLVLMANSIARGDIASRSPLSHDFRESCRENRRVKIKNK